MNEKKTRNIKHISLSSCVIGIAFLTVLLLCTFMTIASAEECRLYFCSSAHRDIVDNQGIPIDAVGLYKKDAARYLFLPAAWDRGSLQIFFTGATSVTIADTAYENGAAISLEGISKCVVKPKTGSQFTVNIMQSESIPAIFIKTETETVSNIKDNKDAKEPGSMVMIDSDGEVEYNGSLEYIKTRGQATFFFNKKPWQIKLTKGAPLCGMEKNKKFILLANYIDKSLLRNRICLDMARASGGFSYVPQAQAVDLYINHAYWGNYLLTEKNEIDNDRLDIFDLEKATEAMNDVPLSEMPSFGERLYQVGKAKGKEIPNEPEDHTGGYLILINSRVYFAHESGGFVTSRGQAVTLQSPKNASKAQVEYVQGLMQSLENAIFAEDGVDPVTGKHYSEIMDVKSFVYRYVQAEVTAEHDAQRPYFYKDRDAADPMLYCGPVWDVDNTFGAFTNQKRASAFYAGNDRGQKYYWFPRALQHPELMDEAKHVYREVYAPLLRVLLGMEQDDTGSLRSIDEYAREVSASAQMDNVRWPIAKTRQGNFNPNTGATPEKNIEYLKNYIQKRMEFLNKQWLE